jgi:putative transposase
MIDPTHKLPVVQQTRLLSLARSTAYYQPRPIPVEDLALMRRIDALHLEHPFAGARMLRDFLLQEGYFAGRKHVATLMRLMGIEALYNRPNTSRRHPKHPVYPYLLRNRPIDQPNQAWAMDITYIPMARGFVYQAAVIDWATRRVLAHRVSISMHTDFCIEAVEEAITKYGVPDRERITISMDGKGCWRDNLFVERLWKSVKYEEVYLRAYASVSAAKAGIARYLAFYNSQRPHRMHQGRTPDEMYFGLQEVPLAA